MKKKSLLVLLFFFLPCSCTTSTTESYTIEEGSLIQQENVYQLTNSLDTNLLQDFQFTVDWQFSDTALFFTKQCPLTSKELQTLLENESDFSNVSFQEEKYSCTGTTYFSYSPKENITPLNFTFDTSSYTGLISLVYQCSLQEYIIHPNDESEDFSIYLQADSMMVSIAKA